MEKYSYIEESQEENILMFRIRFLFLVFLFLYLEYITFIFLWVKVLTNFNGQKKENLGKIFGSQLLDSS